MKTICFQVFTITSKWCIAPISREICNNLSQISFKIGNLNKTCWCNKMQKMNPYLLRTLSFFAGRKLLLWHEQDGVWRVHPGLHPEDPVHHPRLRHQHQEAEAKWPDLWLRSLGKLLAGWFWNGKWINGINLGQTQLYFDFVCLTAMQHSSHNKRNTPTYSSKMRSTRGLCLMQTVPFISQS